MTLKSINDWKILFGERGPSGAAETFLLKLGQVDADTQRAALTALPSVTTLQRRFSDAWERRDSLLGGVPFLAKDLYATAGDATGAGSIFLAEQLGTSEFDSSLVSRIRETGGVLCGKTQLNEFALGMSGENPHFGDCPHPAHPQLLSGGSSSGSAWAVGAGLVPFALGTDTSGSIRVPASFCGIYGLRLEPGLLSEEELFPLSPSFDTPGWLTGTAHDMLTVTEALLGDWINFAAPPTRGLWIPCGNVVSPEVFAATSRLASRLGFISDDSASRSLLESINGVEKSYPVLGASEAALIHK
ncbi:MAG: amidase, partial [Puniceicoccales bacterium]|nr:amidase [Puniceicoccales bacterium]